MLLSKGKCHCGEVELELLLPNSLSYYSARKCDCDFCVNRNITYLSDAAGKLKITSNNELVIHQHGSNQAGFLECENCNNVVAVVYDCDGEKKGAVNASLLSGVELMKPTEIVSPKLLSAEEKVNRWRKLWLDVELVS